MIFFFFKQTLKESRVESRYPAGLAGCSSLTSLTLLGCGRWQGCDPQQWHICPKEPARCWGWFFGFLPVWPLPGSFTSALSECEWASPVLSGDISHPLGAGAKNRAKCRAGSTTHPSHNPGKALNSTRGDNPLVRVSFDAFKPKSFCSLQQECTSHVNESGMSWIWPLFFMFHLF